MLTKVSGFVVRLKSLNFYPMCSRYAKPIGLEIHFQKGKGKEKERASESTHGVSFLIDS